MKYQTSGISYHIARWIWIGWIVQSYSRRVPETAPRVHPLTVGFLFESRRPRWTSARARPRPSRWTTPRTCTSATRSTATSVWTGRTAPASSAASRTVARGRGGTAACTSASPRLTRTRASSSPRRSVSSTWSTGSPISIFKSARPALSPRSWRCVGHFFKESHRFWSGRRRESCSITLSGMTRSINAEFEVFLCVISFCSLCQRLSFGLFFVCLFCFSWTNGNESGEMEGITVLQSVKLFKSVTIRDGYLVTLQMGRWTSLWTKFNCFDINGRIWLNVLNSLSQINVYWARIKQPEGVGPYWRISTSHSWHHFFWGGTFF